MLLLAHITDLHCDLEDVAAARLGRVMGLLGRLTRPLDALLVTGDIANGGLPDEYREARKVIGDRHRIVACPGNHDDRAAYREAFLDQPPATTPVNEVHEVGDWLVVTCDSTIPGRPEGLLADETLQWLSGVLDGAKTTRTLIAFHHPPVVLHEPLLDGMRQQRTERLADLLAGHPQVAALLHGHAHTAAATTFAGRPLLGAAATRSTMRLPFEDAGIVDESMPPAVAFHVLDDDGRVTTHHRVVL